MNFLGRLDDNTDKLIQRIADEKQILLLDLSKTEFVALHTLIQDGLGEYGSNAGLIYVTLTDIGENYYEKNIMPLWKPS